MKIILADGGEDAVYLAGRLLSGRHKLTVINRDKAMCERISSVHDIPVVYGDPCRKYILEDAGIEGADLMVSLCDKDADSLEVCQMAKDVFGVKKSFCIVSNPQNVEVFRTLGVDQVISAAEKLAVCIETGA